MQTAPALRRDAELNRRRILEAAGEVFAERGFGASLDDVARAAGVGVGTVYRRFRDKDALIDELFDDKLAEIGALVDESMAIEDPWEGLVTFMERFLALQARNQGLKQVLFARGGDRVAEVRERILPSTGRVIARAQAAGVLRADVVPEDFPMIGGIMVGALMEATRDADPDLWRRYLTLVLDGLRPARDGTTPLPVRALAQEQVDEVMRCMHA